MEARGQLPQEKSKLLAIMDRHLSMSEADRTNYTLGKRLGNYRNMDDMQDENHKEFLQRKASEILKAYPGQFDEICHQLPAQVV